MFSRILVSSDASEASDHMLACIEGLRRFGAGSLLLVHAMDVRDVGGLYASLSSRILPRLEAQKKVLEAAGFEVAIEVPLGAPAAEIEALARRHACGLVVVASRGHTLARDIVLGGTACAVLHRSSLPVLLVRIELLDEEGGDRCRVACEDLAAHLLFPTDFSDTAERAFQVLAHVAVEASAPVTLLHVQDRGLIEPHLTDRREEFDRIDRERLQRMRHDLLERGVPTVEVELAYGSPTGVLLERARSRDFSLIVMGSQGRGFIPEIFMGSVAHNVARDATLPVIFVPAPR